MKMTPNHSLRRKPAHIPAIDRWFTLPVAMTPQKPIPRRPVSIASLLLFALLNQCCASAQSAAEPTIANSLAADQALARAIRGNDAKEISRWLDGSWAVVSTAGGIGEGPSVFPDGIRSGDLTRTTFEISEPRVRLYGNTALVTAKISTSGVLRGKPFDVIERQTDVWLWKHGAWKCVLTHETKIENK